MFPSEINMYRKGAGVSDIVLFPFNFTPPRSTGTRAFWFADRGSIPLLPRHPNLQYAPVSIYPLQIHNIKQLLYLDPPKIRISSLLHNLDMRLFDLEKSLVPGRSGTRPACVVRRISNFVGHGPGASLSGTGGPWTLGWDRLSGWDIVLRDGEAFLRASEVMFGCDGSRLIG